MFGWTSVPGHRTQGLYGPAQGSYIRGQGASAGGTEEAGGAGVREEAAQDGPGTVTTCWTPLPPASVFMAFFFCIIIFFSHLINFTEAALFCQVITY